MSPRRWLFSLAWTLIAPLLVAFPSLAQNWQMPSDRTVNYAAPPPKSGQPPLFVNGHQLVGPQLENILFVATKVVPQLRGGRAERIKVASIASWWGLKEGTFSFKNPHSFSSCTERETTGKRDVRLGPLDTCAPRMPWQVGLAGVQVPDFSEQEVLSTVRRLWPGKAVKDVLSDTVTLAGWDPTSGTGAAILTSTGDVEKSWLLRNPVVGLTLVERNVTPECIRGSHKYCYGMG